MYSANFYPFLLFAAHPLSQSFYFFINKSKAKRTIDGFCGRHQPSKRLFSPVHFLEGKPVKANASCP